jgi:hypothetical protein
MIGILRCHLYCYAWLTKGRMHSRSRVDITRHKTGDNLRFRKGLVDPTVQVAIIKHDEELSEWPLANMFTWGYKDICKS